MTHTSIENVVFSATAAIVAIAAAIALYIFFGPNGEQIYLIGLPQPRWLIGFPVIALISAWLVSGKIVSRKGKSTGAGEGALIGFTTFLSCVLVYGVFVAVVIGFDIAIPLVLAALVFGGLAFGIPAVLVGALVGAVLTRRRVQ